MKALLLAALVTALTACDSKEIYDAKVEKYHQMFCAGARGLDHRYPQPDCEERRGPKIGSNP